jgi:hypothetical protein
MTADRPAKRRAVPRLPWLKVLVRDEMVVLGFGAVEKPMTADQAVRLAEQLLEAARGADFTRGYRLGSGEESAPVSLAESTKRMPLPSRDAAIAKLVTQVETMLLQAGVPFEFDTAAWITRWLEDPLPALGGARPIDYMNTPEGQALVSKTLALIPSGAYA